MKLNKEQYLKIIASFKRNKHAYLNRAESKGLIIDLNNILSKKEFNQICVILDKYAILTEDKLFIDLSLNFLNDLMDYLSLNNSLFDRNIFFEQFSHDVVERILK